MIKRIRVFTIPALAALLLTAGSGWAQTVKQPVYAVADGEPTDVIVGYAELEDGDVVEVELTMDARDTSFHTTLEGRMFEGTLTSGVWTVREVLTDDLREVVAATVEIDDDPLGRDDDDHDDDDHADDDDVDHDSADDDYGDDDHDGRDDDMNDDNGAHDGEAEDGTDDDGDDDETDDDV